MTLSDRDISFDEAIAVDSVAEEYQIIRRQRCDCGGALRLIRQQLVTHQKHYYDMIETQCEACDKPRDFLFDVSEFFEGNRT